jgi:coenzyme PQQ synthesis protein D (PqqD)
MIKANNRFRVNEKLVTSKMIDGEAIIINLANGMYYSLDKTGAVVWLLVGGGYSLDEAADVLRSRFSAPLEQVREDLVSLVNDLVKHNLVLPVEGNAGKSPVQLDPPTGDPYEAPVLNCYDDMGDVLALDPPLPQVEIENESWEPSTK